MITPQTVSPTLDDLYHMVSSIYMEKNAMRPASATFAHFVETCGMLTTLDRKKKREDVTIVDALCKSLGWFFPLLAKFRVSSIEDLIYRKYPYVCPYCRLQPHKDSRCKTTKGTESSVNHEALMDEYDKNNRRRPKSLNGWQQMFDDIYPREMSAVGNGRSSLGLLEELGELAEAVRVFDKYPKYFAGEAADVFSYIMGIANEYKLTQEKDSLSFDFEQEFLLRYPGLCLQCGYDICVCPSVPESTVGRLAKELDIGKGEIFCVDMSPHIERGKVIGSTLLDSLGGLPAVANKLPLDRGEANRALLLLCFKLAGEIQIQNANLAEKLRNAAINASSQTRAAGTRGSSPAFLDVVNVLSSVWPLLDLAAIAGDDSSMEARVGKVLRAKSCRIGIVTALPLELSAVRMMLEQELDYPIANDPNSYLLGTIPADDGIGSHVVAVTLLKQMGNNSAAAAASHLLRSFPSVDEIFMVGIAGGIPSYTNASSHVRLGDLVVSKGQGVVQYDNLKVGVDRVIVRSSSDKPSAAIVDIINRLESDRLMKKKLPWEGLLSRGKELENGDRPSDESDKLYAYADGKETLVEHPSDVDRTAGMPRIHYGMIGAANTLLKDPTLRDKVAADCGVIAIEMEGSGIADATWIDGKHYTLIRGVCDYCDPKKTNEWQMYAAVVAASYARMLISKMPLMRDNPPVG